jgi:ADP-heptose:LPS heptosyltransferase
VIGGSKADREKTGKVIRAYGGKVTDLTGLTSLPELALVLRNAQCLIAVDTGAVHLAAGVGCPVFGLFSGSNYGRFAPYPKDIAAGFFAIYPDEIEEKISLGLFPGKEKAPMHLMRYIRPEKVIERIKQHFTPRAMGRPGAAGQ